MLVLVLNVNSFGLALNLDLLFDTIETYYFLLVYGALSLSLSVLTAIFSGEPAMGYPVLLELKTKEVVVTIVELQSCKAPAKSLPQSNHRPTFYRPGALPVAQPTVSKH